MKCSICGQSGHNKRSCTASSNGSVAEPRDRAIILRVDNMTQAEQDEMHTELVKLKKRVTSNEAKATLVEGGSKELPSKIRVLIEQQGKK
ncbi:hypothetical protein H5123_19655 [Shewanella sp. SR43-4]|uniref:hypothetical protein n=1 Tax=Shewanella sp. SR43-4 TaxID=2760942 RepID=UPI0015FE7527|nr:hypothetical protein [Shewanella sp. SR43-4]MBB1319839.1 hypothetical protein [Shewanella sp. SR43-4]